MPMKRELYPENWEQIAAGVKDKANWTCEECDRICRKKGESVLDLAQRIEGKNNQFLDWVNQTALADLFDKPQRFTLTVAHLDHNPANCELSNLKALCSVCHLRYDQEHHRKSRARNARLRQEKDGQIPLTGVLD
ncbi:hypothetical protein [Leptothoe spongobia]|uniref:HNH endonuclease n=1 Tax=Leptothoe spongobia TAU-MAC 1115 TaxID=1967444 RepID=A0A947DGG3_9CYAN|nr:hypothetical protein [Leptothoe spongobia]MBT9316305.1 hypothetical protein [Leptothoe spongobia TAU-MAC 1115]